MHTKNKNIPFGKERKAQLLKAQKEHEKESHINAFAYTGWLALKKVHNCHRDNNGTCYNGDGTGGGSSQIRVPSIKRSRKIWKNFYIMFPKYKALLDECITGTRKCVINGDIVSVEIPETTHRTFVDYKQTEDNNGNITINEVIVHMNPVEDKKYILHNNTVKLRIL